MCRRESGGIGRRPGFRFQCRKAWGFESPLSHQSSQHHRPRRQCSWRGLGGGRPPPGNLLRSGRGLPPGTALQRRAPLLAWPGDRAGLRRSRAGFSISILCFSARQARGTRLRARHHPRSVRRGNTLSHSTRGGRARRPPYDAHPVPATGGQPSIPPKYSVPPAVTGLPRQARCLRPPHPIQTAAAVAARQE